MYNDIVMLQLFVPYEACILKIVWCTFVYVLVLNYLWKPFNLDMTYRQLPLIRSYRKFVHIFTYAVRATKMHFYVTSVEIQRALKRKKVTVYFKRRTCVLSLYYDYISALPSWKMQKYNTLSPCPKSEKIITKCKTTLEYASPS